MPTPSIQTLVTDAQQVLNLDSISAVRSVVAVALANANTGTPLNPNLTTQQLWNEFYQVVTKPKSDIESIIANQLMKFLFAPPAPGGVGADKQVIFNDGGVLAGDPQFLWNKTTNLLTVTGAATITGDLTVKTNVLKVDSANNRVGINTASPQQAFEVVAAGINTIFNTASAADSRFELRNNNVRAGYVYWDTSEVRLFADTSRALTFYQNGTLGMTLNSTGLGVGVVPSAGKFEVQESGTGSGIGGIFTSTVSGGGNPGVVFRTASTNRWSLSITGSAGAESIRFYDINNAATRVTITDAGNLLVGTTSSLPSFANGRIEVLSAASSYCMVADATAASAAGIGVRGNDSTVAASFYNASTGGTVGSIVINSGGVSYNTTSDYRLKESIKPISGGLARVNALKPSIYNWKSNGSSGEGFLAHELAEVVPFAVTGEKDAINEDGSIKAQSIDMSRVVPILVAAIQELTARVQTLETR